MPLLCVDGDLDAFRQHNNCYLMRDVIPLDRRAMISTSTTAQSAKHLIDPLFADLRFAGLPELMPEVTAKLDGRPDFSTDRMMGATLSLDFHSFFATNPEVVKPGLGLELEAFKDFRFLTDLKPGAKSQARHWPNHRTCRSQCVVCAAGRLWNAYLTSHRRYRQERRRRDRSAGPLRRGVSDPLQLSRHRHPLDHRYGAVGRPQYLIDDHPALHELM